MISRQKRARCRREPSRESRIELAFGTGIVIGHIWPSTYSVACNHDFNLIIRSCIEKEDCRDAKVKLTACRTASVRAMLRIKVIGIDRSAYE
jgi:hypothetical protein